jgi:hypothetical protein
VHCFRLGSDGDESFFGKRYHNTFWATSGEPLKLQHVSLFLGFGQVWTRVGGDALRENFARLVETVISTFGEQYLNREPTVAELENILREYEEEGFPGCRGSVDCTHVYWKNYPTSQKGQYKSPHASKLIL